ncbi:MAG TPA: hypothetical protein VEI55_00610 [Candidatus Acidoferrum sp.]|nr:hypothetical protein [Candidatus Acidoferrum sp.]
MKRLMALGVLTVGLTLPTHAQTAHTAAGGAANLPTSNGSGGWGGGGGSTAGSRPVSHPRAQFNTTSVSGSQNEYVPSVFVSYDRAIATGQNALDTPPPTVAEAARQQSNTHPEKAKLALVQDIHGRAMVISQ